MADAFKTIREQLLEKLRAALQGCFAEQGWQAELPSITLTPPKQAEHGDFACPVALQLAKPLRKNPREIAQRLQEAVGDAGGLLSKTEVAGPGYLNLFVAAKAWHRVLTDMLRVGPDFLRSNWGAGRRVLLEYVSANPTGPLHIAHGRGAVVGDVVARLLEMTGHRVSREYYVNDLGNQVDVLARSVYLRYGELFGRAFTPPEDFYPGDYVTDIARELAHAYGERYLDQPEADWLDVFRRGAVERMLARIRADLQAFGVHFDRWQSERELAERVDLQDFVASLQERELVYAQEGKLWFRSSELGDDKDRVVVREDGRPTYFASDIAYHHDKLERGHEHLINVWGADHGGYIARVRAGLQALGHSPATLEVLLVQMVSLSRGGEAVRMGKRLGTAVWLRDVVEEAGRDATRYFFVLRSPNSQMDFDLSLATQKSLDNPVYYAQMGHARMCSIARRAERQGIAEPTLAAGALDALQLPEELNLIKSMQLAPDVVSDAARSREPHRVVYYIQDLIAQFHSYYTQYKHSERVISDDPEKTEARLLLCRGLQQTLRALLEDVLGVHAPESMHLEDGEAASEPLESE